MTKILRPNDNGMQAWDSELHKALLAQHVKSNVFRYYEDRSKGLIAQCEEPGWGNDDPQHREQIRRMNEKTVLRSFFEVNWNKSFTGRRVRREHSQVNVECVFVGPKDEAPKEEDLEQPPVLKATRDLWKAVDRGEDEGVDTLYRIYRDTSNYEGAKGPLSESEDEEDDIGPINERKTDGKTRLFDISEDEGNVSPQLRIRNQAQLDPSSNDQKTLRSIAGQACRMLGDHADPIDKPQLPAELDPSGELRDVLGQISEEDSQMHEEILNTTRDVESSESSWDTDTASCSCKKRRRDSIDGPGTNASRDQVGHDTDRPRPGQKRRRISQYGHSGPPKEVPRIIYNNYDDSDDDDSKSKASPQKLMAPLHSQPRDGASPRISKEPFTDVYSGHSQQDVRVLSTHAECKEHPTFTNSRGTKRPRESSMDDSSSNIPGAEPGSPKPKRTHLEEHQKCDSSKNMSEDNPEVGDSLSDSRDESPQIFEKGVRPTFFGSAKLYNPETGKYEFMPDNNETDELLVTSVRDLEPGEYGTTLGSSSRVEPVSRPWTEDEEETLRSWVQDYGIQQWDQISWCLWRSQQDCQEHYQGIIMTRNQRAGRYLFAGLPGWVDPELEVPSLPAQELSRESIRQRQAQEAATKGSAVEEVEAVATEEEAVASRSPEINRHPNTVVKPEPELGPWPEVEGEDPEILYERPSKLNEKKKTPANLEPSANANSQAAFESPPSSRLRTRRTESSIRLEACGLIRYDPAAKTFPKVNSTGALVYSKGGLLRTNERRKRAPRGLKIKKASDEVERIPQASSGAKGAGNPKDGNGHKSDAKNNQPDRDARTRTERYRRRAHSPSVDGSLEDRVLRGRVIKRNSGKARRGIDRRAGHVTK